MLFNAKPIEYLVRRKGTFALAGRLQAMSVYTGISPDAKISAMPQFVIERDIPGAGSMSEEQIREVSLQSIETLKNMGPHIQWLHSYVIEDKAYCVYIAPDEETIREHARKSGIRADRVSAVRRLIDPKAFN